MEFRSEETYGDELEMMRCTAHERSLSGACSVLGVGNMAFFFIPFRRGEATVPVLTAQIEGALREQQHFSFSFLFTVLVR